MNKFKFYKQAFKGNFLQVYSMQQQLPNGFNAKLEIVKHPGAVLIVPFLKANRVIMICQYRPVVGAYLWELPAGTLDVGEKPLACARRELIEEIGYKAGKLKKIGFIYPAPGYTTEKIIIYEAYGLIKTESFAQEDEVIEAKVLTKKEINELLARGKIVDAKTICALRLAKII